MILQEAPGFNSTGGPGPSLYGDVCLHVLLVSEWVLPGYSGLIPQSKNMHLRLTGDSKLGRL